MGRGFLATHLPVAAIGREPRADNGRSSASRGEDEVAVKVIVELQVKPGRRAELSSLLESMVANHGPSQRGFLGSTRYEVLDDHDMLIEIAD
jgi:hypothetical protein